MGGRQIQRYREAHTVIRTPPPTKKKRKKTRKQKKIERNRWKKREYVRSREMNR